MDNYKNEQPEKAKAWLAGIRHDREDVEKHLDELEKLLETLGIDTAGKSIAQVKTATPAFLTGSGKADEIIKLAKEAGASLIVFDDDLTPSQQRNWEKASGLEVIDRQAVIIEIFAQRAATREASLQVELASCKYRLPRLAGAWQHLSRQRGGFYGTRGEGEKQIEVDKRLLLKKIAKLKKELEEVSKQRETRKKLRSERNIFSCAIAGYTNAGKSTLLNSLTGSQVSTGNRLFDTLDPATRKYTLPGGREIVITDTVGFIRKLPHQLVEAFKSTLEETLDADLIILLLDASDREVKSHYKTALEVLKEIGADPKKILTVFNKADLCSDEIFSSMLARDFPGSFFISASERKNIDMLALAIEKAAAENDTEITLFIPAGRYDILAQIRQNGKILEEEYGEYGVMVKAVVPAGMAARIGSSCLVQYSMEKPEYTP